ncbi:MAG: isocitrate/isopropylmalate dehydrogenase family protein [Acidobacteriota bacterium]
MTTERDLRIAVLPGDGIGPEVMTPCLELIARLDQQFGGLGLRFDHCDAGAGCYRKQGVAIPDDSLQLASNADAILLGAMGLPEVRYPDGREIAPQLDLRESLELYAGLRPVRSLPGLPAVLADPRAQELDLVLVRESTEGLFAARGRSEQRGDEAVLDTLVITRRVSERLFDFAFNLARQRKAAGSQGRVTCIDKANVLGAFAFFRKIFFERAERYPDIEADCAYVDAMGLHLLQRPWSFDVLVTENMFGDILSDVGAALMGGMGMAPSADLGDDHAVFQPCHGSAPDIAGQGKANPTAMLLSAALMLKWLGERHHRNALSSAGQQLEAAIATVFATGRYIPYEQGGDAGTHAIVAAVAEALEAQNPASLAAGAPA